MKITQYLNTQNQTQRIIIGLVVSLSIILLFIHNPFSGYITDLPFSLWRTNSPLIDWLGNVVHFMYSLLIVISIGAIFVGYVFSNRSENELALLIASNNDKTKKLSDDDEVQSKLALSSRIGCIAIIVFLLLPLLENFFG